MPEINLGRVVGADGKQGEVGPKGDPASINGFNVLTVTAEDPVVLSQDGAELKIRLNAGAIPSAKDAVTVPNGATIEMGESFGEGPYTFEFSEDGEGSAVSAAEVSYDGTTSGLAAGTVQGALDFISVAIRAPEMHRMIFRGKNLGSVLTDEQKAAIQNGTFEDLYLGDYWVINGVNWRIADFDYWWNCGDTPFLKHHLAIMPDVNLGANKQMNATNTTEGGYVGSLMYTTNMADAKAMCTAAFGANILTNREYLVNAVANGKPSGGAWLNSSIELPNECMIYGHPHFGVANDGTTIPHIYTIDKTQLALFALAPKFITTRQHYWLRDVVSAVYFALVYDNGSPGYYYASLTNIGVRPVFPLGVAQEESAQYDEGAV